MLKAVVFCRKLNLSSRHIGLFNVLRNEENIVKKPKRKVSEPVELVTLVDQNDKILGLKSKLEAQNLARKLNLTLERLSDQKYGKVYTAYKLLASSEILKSTTKTSSSKTLKKLALNSRISDHDLHIKLQTIRKWLLKQCEVHIAITGSSETASLMKNILEKIQDDLKDECRITNSRSQADVLKFILLPPKEDSVTKGTKPKKIPKDS